MSGEDWIIPGALALIIFLMMFFDVGHKHRHDCKIFVNPNPALKPPPNPPPPPKTYPPAFSARGDILFVAGESIKTGDVVRVAPDGTLRKA